MSAKYTECNRCGKAINYGNAYVTIVRNIEQADFDFATNNEEVDIIDSTEVITFCVRCGNTFNASIIATIINAIPYGQDRINEN